MEPSINVRKRIYLIIGALAVVGIASLSARVLVKQDYGLIDALLDLGYEGLPAAILFLLIDGAIHQYEQRQEIRLRAVRALRGERRDTATDLLQDLADGDVIRLGVLQGAVLENIRLKNQTLCEGDLDRSDVDSLELSGCTIRNVSLCRTLLRLAALEHCTVASVQFDDADLTGSLFVKCEFDRETTFNRATLSDVRFNRCTFAPEVLASMDPSGARFLDCQGISTDLESKLRAAGATVETSP
jgi:uncharacterized protein YjbI with pentapeptide repeats